MARFRGAKNLSCFYCGKRSGRKFDGTTRDFQCQFCDATNYLDQNGEITDPPVATEREAPAVQFAAPSAPSPADSIFCQTCLKNQHLFTKSLAQYLPDDPSDPEYETLERNYYRYRRGLEKRYPQVCDDCAEKADARIRQAGYTAKTDHLRRMMLRSRRRDTRTRTKLDWVSAVGKSLWRMGFVLQLLWHLVAALELADGGMYDPDAHWATRRRAAEFAARMPRDALINWSIRTGIAAVWWNPHFVQVNRGFTRHLLGFTQWYSFQGLVVFFRFIFRRVMAEAPSRNALLAAHAAMAAATMLIYVLAGRSIRVDMTPLFATETPLSPQTSPVTRRERKKSDAKTFSELFNDALESSAAPQRVAPSPQSSPFNPVQPSKRYGFAAEHTPIKAPQPHYAEEMDWSPATPQHRALHPPPVAPTFGQTNGHIPQDEAKNPFWYKVPAAPVDPARKLRNPPREQKAEPLHETMPLFSRRRSRGAKPTSGEASVEFKQPSFFAPERDHDTSSLADLLGSSFSLGHEEPESVAEPTDPAPTPPPTSQRRPPVFLTTALAAWLLVSSVEFVYQWEAQLAILFAAGVIALRGAGDASQVSDTPGPLAYVYSVVNVVELASICWVASEVCSGRASEVNLYGAAALTTMLAHEMVTYAL